jgi:hypothetical protein
MTTTMGMPSSRALPRTKRVWGKGAVRHHQRPLHLATEVGVTGGVDDVDGDALVRDRRVLGEDGDAALALEIVRIHEAIDHGLVGAEYAGLAKHRIDQGGLTVVDVGDDRDVPEIARGSMGHGAR